MHETGLIYIPSFEDVGQEEVSRHTGKVGGASQMKGIAQKNLQDVTCNGP